MLALDGSNQVGRISKQWGGFAKEAFTDADTFGITCKYRLFCDFEVMNRLRKENGFLLQVTEFVFAG